MHPDAGVRKAVGDTIETFGARGTCAALQRRSRAAGNTNTSTMTPSKTLQHRSKNIHLNSVAMTIQDLLNRDEPQLPVTLRHLFHQLLAMLA